MNINTIYKIWALCIVFLVAACVVLHVQTGQLNFSRVCGDRLRSWSELPHDRPILVWLIHGYPPGLNAGSEFMAHTMNRHLVGAGYTVVVACPRYPHVIFEGVHLMDLNNASTVETIVSKSAIIMSHHDKVAIACKLGQKHSKPVIELVHNTIRPLSYSGYKPYRIYNSNWLRRFYKADLDGSESIVVRPPVDWRDYETPDGHRRYVTLINVNEEKGGHVLVALAQAMPHVEFMGIKGAYGEQVVPTIKPANLHYENTTLNIRNVYERTRILIMPSRIETWGRTAVEAMSSGIPVIANTTDGLIESLGEAGIFARRDRLDEWITAINELLTNTDLYKKTSEACKIRAVALDPAADLEDFVEFVDSKIRAGLLPA